MSKEVYPGITQEMIDAAKKAYPKQNHVKVTKLQADEDGDAFLYVIIRRPDRTVLGEFSKWVEKSPNKADLILVKACLLSHKDQVLADEDLLTSAVDAIAQLITIRKAEIKNV